MGVSLDGHWALVLSLDRHWLVGVSFCSQNVYMYNFGTEIRYFSFMSKADHSHLEIFCDTLLVLSLKIFSEMGVGIMSFATVQVANIECFFRYRRFHTLEYAESVYSFTFDPCIDLVIFCTTLKYNPYLLTLVCFFPR